MENVNNTKDREIVLSRIVNATAQLVWQVWTNAEHLDKWWGPNDFTNVTKEMDFSVGGKWRYTMHGPNNMDFANRITYTKIEELAVLEYHHTDDEEPPAIEFYVSVTFEDLGDKTKVTQRSIFPTAEALRKVVEENGAIEGGKQHLGNLDSYVTKLSGEKNFTISREINAPVQLVWDTLTQAEHLKHWWGPVALKISHATVDLQPGGMFHYGMEAPDGNTMWGRFVFREIDEPNKLVYVSSFSDADGGLVKAPFPGIDFPLEVLNILTLKEHNGKTILTLTGEPINPTPSEEETYKGMTQSMQQGFSSTYDQLDKYLETITPKA
ncbi:MAG: SRPBCC domain-containing protein [Sphingobacteriales bacterium JAD_PAG50586_3]|nr:MAG: SRPBCC domain-containing protein [Sphingobacteriales bacterium JAD_PAG50586_3]